MKKCSSRIRNCFARLSNLRIFVRGSRFASRQNRPWCRTAQIGYEESADPVRAQKPDQVFMRSADSGSSGMLTDQEYRVVQNVHISAGRVARNCSAWTDFTLNLSELCQFHPNGNCTALTALSGKCPLHCRKVRVMQIWSCSTQSRLHPRLSRLCCLL